VRPRTVFLFCLNFDSKFDSKVSNEPGGLHARFYTLAVCAGLVLAFCVIGEICSQQTAHVGLLPAMWHVELSAALHCASCVIGPELSKRSSRNLLTTDFSIGCHWKTVRASVHFCSFALRWQQAGRTMWDWTRGWQALGMPLTLREAVLKAVSVANRFRHRQLRNPLTSDFSIGCHWMTARASVCFCSFLLRWQQAGQTELICIRGWQALGMPSTLREAVSKVFSVANRFRHS